LIQRHLPRIKSLELCPYQLRVGSRSPILLNRQEIAASVGEAPFNRDRGRYSGKRRIWGRRAEIRSWLHMAAVVAIAHNPPWRAYYQHLREKGKLKKVAIVACIRK